VFRIVTGEFALAMADAYDYASSKARRHKNHRPLLIVRPRYVFDLQD